MDQHNILCKISSQIIVTTCQVKFPFVVMASNSMESSMVVIAAGLGMILKFVFEIAETMAKKYP
ncbi:Os08g0230901 [Oryza sativa Japonica Group]|uniref:Os08g0230901 protein n=1 Tax=Oryza sativa subsp. japonica TaxID=39947 RepID=C7J672_ORYSJ|nr:Os08g0230901 [Oryza sativa Japonica Group]|eukprot:NP_001175448.1 Os08g0230901 [Oryza sativa Japonica Group]